MHSNTDNTPSPVSSSPTGSPSKEELLRKLDGADEKMARDENISNNAYRAFHDLVEVNKLFVEELQALKSEVAKLKRSGGGWGNLN